MQPSISVEVANPVAWELSDYIIKFKTAGLLPGPADFIDIMFPTGTDLATVTSVSVTVPATLTTYTVIGTNLHIWLAAGEVIEWGVDVTILLENVTYPAPGVTVTANFVAVCELTISSTIGGSVIAPGEGTFTYDEGKAVELVAKPGESYRFVNRTGDVDIIDQIEYAETTIAIGGNYEITANFEERVGGCFIATAAYGTPMAEEVEILREFRDECLLTNPVGRCLVDIYYRFSPPIAESTTEHPSLKPIVRVGPLPTVAVSAVVVNTAMPGKRTTVALSVQISVTLVLWKTRREGRGPEHTYG